jgi:hypothetical protein
MYKRYNVATINKLSLSVKDNDRNKKPAAHSGTFACQRTGDRLASKRA